MVVPCRLRVGGVRWKAETGLGMPAGAAQAVLMDGPCLDWKKRSRMRGQERVSAGR